MLVNNKEFRVFLKESEILERVKALAMKVNNDYAGKNPLMLIVLKGAVIFASDLIRTIEIECDFEFIQTASYYNSTQSSGKVKINEFGFHAVNRHILIIEDIVDTGLTIQKLTEGLINAGADSVETVALLSKSNSHKNTVNIKYSGFEIPDLFVLGYGMDFAQKGRNLRDIYILSD
jgi:hypoxanthine phosphoribosyltransferase